MTQVPQLIWNQIGYENYLKTIWAREFFNLSTEKIDQALDKYADEQTASNKAKVAFITIAPLYLEREAIQSFIDRQESPSLRAALPEVTTLNEALKLAELEYSLSDNELLELKKLLEIEERLTA